MLLPYHYAASLLNVCSFLQQLGLAVTKVRELEQPHKIASDEFAAYMKQPNRDASESRARMRQVREWNTSLAEARKLEAAINQRIDDKVKGLTLKPYQSLCTQILAKLPRELRNHIYSYAYPGQSIDVFEPKIDSVMDLPLLRDWTRRDPDRAPLTTMKLWLGEVLTYELLEHWYESSTFEFLNDPAEILLLAKKDLWGSSLLPYRFIRTVALAVNLSDDNMDFGVYLKSMEHYLLSLRKEITITIDIPNDRVHLHSQRAEILLSFLQRLLQHFHCVKLKMFNKPPRVRYTIRPRRKTTRKPLYPRYCIVDGRDCTFDSLRRQIAGTEVNVVEHA
jgi:hypothetical protein